MKPGTEWYPWYPRDYRDKTLSAGLTRDEHGGYRLLIDAYYLNGGPLPDDDKKLAVIVLSTAREWRTKLRPVMAQFFQVSDGRWHHKRIDEELERRATRHEERHKTATKAARLRWKTGATENSHAESENPTKSRGDPMPEALPEHCLMDSPGNACAIHNLQEDYSPPPLTGLGGDNLLHSAAFAARQSDSAEGAPLASPGGPRGAPQPTSHKSKRSVPEPGAPPWEQRCRAWAESGFWMEMWGPEPSEAGCHAPGELAAEARKTRNGHNAPPPRTPEDIVAVDALAKETLTAIKRKAANANGPVLTEVARLDDLDAWVDRNLDGDECALARKAIKETRKAGDNTPPAIRKLVDDMDELRRGQTSPSAAC